MKLEQAALDRELQAILLPMKVREAELNLAKLEGDVKLKSAYLDRAIISTKQSTRAYEDAVRNGGAGQDPNAPTIGRWSAARYVGQPAQTTTPAASPKPKLNWSVVKPAATSTGP